LLVSWGSWGTDNGPNVKIGLAQDPGPAGKQHALWLTRNLAGYQVVVSPELGEKEERAMPVAAQANVGNLLVVAAPWNRSFIEELRDFPAGAHDDQVDALSRAFSVVGMKRPPMQISDAALAGWGALRPVRDLAARPWWSPSSRIARACSRSRR
jgi:hypothetical protein